MIVQDNKIQKYIEEAENYILNKCDILSGGEIKLLIAMRALKKENEELKNIINNENQIEYRYLREGEVIQEGDECDICNDGWRDDPKWVQAKDIGGLVPNPAYPSHRKYRRIARYSKLYDKIFNIVKRLDLIKTDKDSFDHISATRELEKLFLEALK